MIWRLLIAFTFIALFSRGIAELTLLWVKHLDRRAAEKLKK